MLIIYLKIMFWQDQHINIEVEFFQMIKKSK